jgi:hypothetical protein
MRPRSIPLLDTTTPHHVRLVVPLSCPVKLALSDIMYQTLVVWFGHVGWPVERKPDSHILTAYMRPCC